MGNTRNTGYLQNIVQYDASNNITLPANLTVTGSIVGYATTSYVTTQINNLVNGAPGALDTLNELAAALGNDASFAATLTTSLSGKQASLSGTGFVKSTAGTISYDTSAYITLSSLSVTSPLTYNNSTGALNINQASSTVSGWLSYTDWVTFNGKQAAGNYVTTDTTQTISGAKTFTTQLWIGSNAVIGGSNGQIQFDAAASSDLFISCIPGTRTVQIRNGNSGAPNYSACGLITGYATFLSTISAVSGIYIQAANNSDLPFINFSNNGGVYNWGRIGGLLQGDGDGSLYFQTKLGGALGTRLTITSTGASTFSNTITAAGLIIGQASIYQSDPGGVIASNRWGTYNGGSTAMTFAYNASGSVVWTNNTDRMFLTGDGYLGVGITPTYPLHITSTIANYTAGIINTSSGNNAGLLIKAGINSGNEILRCQTGTGANRFLVDVSGEITSTDGEMYFKRTAFDNYGHIYMGSNRHFYVRNSGAYNMYLQTNGVNQITLQNDGVTVISQLRTSTLYSDFAINLTGAYSNGTYYKICDSSQLTSSGIYMIVAYVDTYAIGGGIYFCTFASVPFYWFAGGSNSGSIQTLPTMLGTGHHNLNPPIVRIRLSTGASSDGGKQFLEFDPNANWSNVQGVSGATVTFYVKRIGS
jgi:hypothetical protein